MEGEENNVEGNIENEDIGVNQSNVQQTSGPNDQSKKESLTLNDPADAVNSNLNS